MLKYTQLQPDGNDKLAGPPKIGPLGMQNSCKITTGGNRSENKKVFGGADIPDFARG